MSNLYVKGKDSLIFNDKEYRCAIGSNGFTETPQEGDKATPLGTYALRECWYRADRIYKPKTGLPLRIIERNDGWCDAPNDPHYNRYVKLPYPASHEELWREDHGYDIIVPIGFNDNLVKPGLGSAIFFHIAKPIYSPTLGCVAVALSDMLEIVKGLDPGSKIIIEP